MKHCFCKRLQGHRRVRQGMRRGALAAALAFLAGAGCSSLPANLAADGDVQVECVDSRDAHIGAVRVGAVPEGLRVSGELRKAFLLRGWIPGHLHLEAMAADGAVLSTALVPYHRRRAKSGQAYFARTMAVRPEAVHTVKVVHHGLGN
ncbi:MAG: hypothetical protein U5S82_04665 [Gammaproteobacteria bacterium]|nr:hypothetical protein [Gammaproteobacteria bacterium]